MSHFVLCFRLDVFSVRQATLFRKKRLDHDSLHGINFTVYYSSIPCKISLNVILGDDLSRSERTSISRVLYLHSSVYHICPRKIFISVKGLHWVSWESRLALMQMTAAVSLTLCSVDRRRKSKDLSGSTAALTARAAVTINISGSNNQGCLFFSKLSVSMTDLF